MYKDEVLGKRVEVEFKVGSVTQFFPGTVQKLKMELVNGEISCQHFIAFDDGDEFWFELEKKEKAGQLRWIDKDSLLSPAAKKFKGEDATPIPRFPIIVLKEC
eukprot:scaffold3437_cov113-Cylindrotheca_fusiformis.AAC.7